MNLYSKHIKIRHHQIVNVGCKHHSFLALILVMFMLFSTGNSYAQMTSDSSLNKRPKVGLVLSGGGAKGFAHIGVLKVLEEAGIEVDYISGTSMGSIVGGLYAIGYNAEFIENLVRSQDWNALLLDKINRKSLSLDHKSFNEQQFISFPVTKQSVSLPFGIKYGQNVSSLLAYMVSPVYQYKKFDEFQTPFLCIGTDIASGESVVLDSGNLARSMRASMAIPSVFTPVTIDGKLLVDGGLVNNFPAKELYERGCDIIIGVDVQFHKDFTVSDLNTITSILDRSAGFYRRALNDTAQNYVDYYIQPDINGYGVGSFGDFDSIMMRGERAARGHWDELLALADYLKQFPGYHMKKRDLQPLSSFVFESMKVIGSTDFSSKLVSSHFGYKKGEVVKLEDLNKRVEDLYGSLFFKTIKYRLQSGVAGTELIIEIEESDFGSIGLGVHYDSDYKAGLLISGNFKNVLIKNSILETTLGLSENPHFSLKYYQNRGMLPGFGFLTRWSSFSFIDYVNGKDKSGIYRMGNLNIDLYTQFVNKQSFAFGGGAQLELTSLRNDVGIDLGINNSTYSQTYFNFFAFFKYDGMDHSFFPHYGSKFNINAVFITKFLTGGNLNFGQTATVVSAEYHLAVPLSKRWTFRTRLNAGLTFGEGVYFSKMFIVGGQGAHYLPGMLSFSGLDVAQLGDRQLIAGRFRLQYNIYKKHYLITTLDLCNLQYNKTDLLNIDRAAIGYGLTWGYDSFVGPIELSVMGSNYRGISGFLNIGFWF